MRHKIGYITILAGFALALQFDSHAAAQIYRWVDDQGVVHFGQIVPEGVEATPVNVRPNTVQIERSPKPEAKPAGPAQGQGTGTADEGEALNQAGQRRVERDERRQKLAQEAAKKQRECDIMQAQKDFLEPSTRVMVTDDDGTLRRLDDNERLEGLAEANAFLAANCDD